VWPSLPNSWIPTQTGPVRGDPVTARPIPTRHWRSYGNHPLSSGAEALDEPFNAFPSWYLRVTCDRCGKDRMLSETHMPQRALLLRHILDRARHDGCGGRAGKADLLTGIAGGEQPRGAAHRASSRLTKSEAAARVRCGGPSSGRRAGGAASRLPSHGSPNGS